MVKIYTGCFVFVSCEVGCSGWLWNVAALEDMRHRRVGGIRKELPVGFGAGAL